MLIIPGVGVVKSQKGVCMEEETNIKVYIHYLPPGKMQGKSMNTGRPFHKEFFRKSGIMVIQESVLIIIFAPLLALSTP